ncbi:MAG TPA: energy-coupling factor transporter transmembrane component T [Candidatus Limnocylindrales bacterium]
MNDAPGELGFVHGASWLHRLSPIPKLAWLTSVVVFAFVSFNAAILASIVIVGLVLATSAGILAHAVRALALLAPLAAAILLLQSIAPAVCGGACTPVASLGPLTIYEEGVARGLTFVLRILAMETAAILVLQTTHPSDLFAALARLRVPYLLNVMIALTLRLVPVLQREVRIVLAAQRSRGMRGTGLAAVVPALVPVFAGTVDRVGQLAISLESRGFGASGPRTSYRRIGFSTRDLVLAVTGVAAGIAAVVATIALGPTASPAFVVPAGAAVALVAAALVVFAGSLVRAAMAIGRA